MTLRVSQGTLRESPGTNTTEPSAHKTEEEQAMLANLHANRTTFKGLLEKSAKALAKNKIQMKKTLECPL